MKKIFVSAVFALSAIAVTGLAGCEKKQSEVALGISTGELSFSAEEGLRTIMVEGKDWTATPSDDEWIRLNADQRRGLLTITARANEGGQRTGYVTVENPYDTKTITIMQATNTAPPDDRLFVEPSELSFETAGGIELISVTSELGWFYDCDDDWVTIETAISEDQGVIGLNVTARANEDTAPRYGVITISNGAFTENVSVTQAATE